jgi:hypothetical protein
MRRELLRQRGLEAAIQFVEPHGAADRLAGRHRQQGIERLLRGRGTLPGGRMP